MKVDIQATVIEILVDLIKEKNARIETLEAEAKSWDGSGNDDVIAYLSKTEIDIAASER